jgi:hypothetical protein
MLQILVLLMLALVLAPAVPATAAEPSQADIDLCRQEAQVAVSQRSGPSTGVGPMTPLPKPPASPAAPGSATTPGLPQTGTGTAPSSPLLSPGSPAQTTDNSAAFQDTFSRCIARRTGGSR